MIKISILNGKVGAIELGIAVLHAIELTSDDSITNMLPLVAPLA